MSVRIVAFSGNTHRPSRTRALVEAVASEVARLRRADVKILDLVDAGPGIAVARRDALPLPAARIVEAIETADALLGRRPGLLQERLEAEFRCRGGGYRVELAFEGSGYEQDKAVQWWRGLGGGRPAPMKLPEALERRDELRRRRAIQVRANGRLSENVAYRFEDGRVFSDVRRREELAA